jgi:hypothetical protein
LGAPDAGKTAIVVSLYLLLSRNQLKGYRFSDSSTLLALDEISRGARRWNEGAPPEQMTNHTELPDERIAGFLHLRLKDTETREAHDLLIPDLPGEWSTTLIDSNRTDRLDFIKGADVLWITIDGSALLKPESRQVAIHRSGMLMQRIKDLLGQEVPPLLLVISHLDDGMPPATTIERLDAETKAAGPRSFLEAEYPLFAGKLEDVEDVEVEAFGVSVVGGDLADDEAFRAKFFEQDVNQAGYIVEDTEKGATEIQDMTLPLAWIARE